MPREIDVYELGSTHPIGTVMFTEEPRVDPSQLTNEKIEPDSRRHVRDTFFSTTFRKYMHQKGFDYDAELLGNYRELLITHIERTTAVSMAQNDLLSSITESGVAIQPDEKLFELSAKMLELKFITNVIGIFGLTEYRDEIMLRELDSNFGTTNTLAAARRQAQRKAEDREEWYHNTIAGVHNMLRELVVTAKSGAGAPEPTSPFMRSHKLPDRFRSQDTNAQPRTQDNETQESDDAPQ